MTRHAVLDSITGCATIGVQPNKGGYWMRYPTYSELIFINGLLLDDNDLQTGKKKVRDIDLLLAAVERPRASAFGADAYPTLKEKAAVLLHSVARNHPFADGNKRTGTVGALFLLVINGQAVTWHQQAAVDRIVNLAEGRTDYAEFVRWLPIEPTAKIAPEPDTERDTQIIQQLLTEQKWLLDELAQR
ncbi:MAG: type II toxin-antitoxin system death-on-curing family toxin [Anaerolineae bacterium]